MDGRRWTTLAWPAATLVVAFLALSAALELVAVVNALWANFPGEIGLRGLLAVVIVLAAGVGGLLAIRRLPAKWGLALAATVLVLTRLGAALLIDPPLVRDPSAYNALAWGVLGGECCFGERPMGYPIMLAGAYALGFSGTAVNLIAALAAGPLVWTLGGQLGGPRGAMIALYLYAVAPSLVLLTGVLLTETVYATLLLAALWLSASRYLPASGLLLGISHYVRGTGILLAPAFMLPLVIRRAWRQLALFMAMLVIALVPVTVATGGISTSTLGGWTLLVGTNQESDGRFNLADRHLYRQVWGDDRDALAREEALRRIVSDPLGFAALAVRKVHTMWAREYYGVQFALTDAGAPGWIRASARLISQAFYAGVFVAAVLALWQMRRGPPVLAAVILAIVLIVAAVHVFTEVQHRYHAYVVPLLIVLTAWHARAASRSIGGGYAEPSPSDEASTSRWAS